MFSPRRVPHGSVRHVMRERHGGTRDSPQPDSLSRVEDTSRSVLTFAPSPTITAARPRRQRPRHRSQPTLLFALPRVLERARIGA